MTGSKELESLISCRPYKAQSEYQWRTVSKAGSVQKYAEPYVRRIFMYIIIVVCNCIYIYLIQCYLLFFSCAYWIYFYFLNIFERIVCDGLFTSLPLYLDRNFSKFLLSYYPTWEIIINYFVKHYWQPRQMFG